MSQHHGSSLSDSSTKDTYLVKTKFYAMYLSALFLGATSISLVIGGLVWGVRYLRMQPDGVFWIYKLRGYCMGITVYYVDDPVLMSQVLNQSDVKGPFLEQVVAVPAWLPIRSVESTDGTEWKTMRIRFDDRLRTLSLAELSHIVDDAVETLQTMPQLDYDTLAFSLATVLLAWVSGTAPSQVPESLSRKLVLATGEWKRAIAMRGPATRSIQNELISQVVTYCAFPVYDADDRASDFIQAFLISPLINITDIFCAIEDADDSLTQMVLRAHPFPFLERRLVVPLGPMAAGSQVMLPLAAVARSHPQSWMVFGGGKRRCPGRGPASCILQKYKTLSRLTTWCPRVGHTCSGRHNDTLSIWEGLAMCCRIVRLCLSWTNGNL
jgi:hypothetical protein